MNILSNSTEFFWIPFMSQVLWCTLDMQLWSCPHRTYILADEINTMWSSQDDIKCYKRGSPVYGRDMDLAGGRGWLEKVSLWKGYLSQDSMNYCFYIFSFNDDVLTQCVRGNMLDKLMISLSLYVYWCKFFPFQVNQFKFKNELIYRKYEASNSTAGTQMHHKLCT